MSQRVKECGFMRSLATRLFVFVTMVNFTLAVSSAESLTTLSTTQPTTLPISVEELAGRVVIGKLGHPLGTLVVISGDVIANNSGRKADVGEPYFLKISSVNGKPLSTAIKYPFRTRETSSEIVEPKIGSSFRYVGYETGAFNGVPSGLRAPWAGMQFGFVTQFLILADSEAQN